MVAFKLNTLVVFYLDTFTATCSVFLHDARLRGVPITVSSLEAQELLREAVESLTLQLHARTLAPPSLTA